MRPLLVAALLLAAAAFLVVVPSWGEPEPGPAAGAGDSEHEPAQATAERVAAGVGAGPDAASAGRGDPDPVIGRVAAAGSLRGRVAWTDGEPAAGASLTCTPRRRGIVPRQVAVAGADGSFLLEGLPSGSHRLRVVHPQATDSLKTDVRIPAGDTLELSDLILARGFPLAGRVVLVAGAERQPARGGWGVRAFSALGGSYMTRVADDGTFRFPAVAPGIYEVVLWHRSWRTSPPVRASAGQHDVLLEAVRGEAVFTGQVTHPDGRPLRVFELEVLDEGSLRAYARTSRSWGEGRYRTMPLPPGSYRLRFLAGGRIPREVRAVLPETGEVRIDVVLPPQRAVRGVVLDAAGRPLPGAHVTVLGEPSGHLAMDRLGLERIFEGLGGYKPGVFGNTDSEGRFSLPPQESASFVLVRDIDHATTMVPVPQRDESDLRIRLAKGVAVVGRLVDGEGRGVAGARIMLFPDGEVLDPRRLDEESDGGGRFAFAPVGPGTWSLLVIRDRGPHLRQATGEPSFDRTFQVGSADIDLGDLR